MKGAPFRSIGVPVLFVFAALIGAWVVTHPNKSPGKMTVAELESSSRRGSKDPEVYRELAYRALQYHRPDEALQHVQAAARFDPYNAENENLRGMILAEKGQMGTAIEAFRQATQLDPKAVEPLLNLGRLALKRGALWLATTSLEKAIRVAPKEAEAELLLGQALKERSFSAQAKTHIRKALELRPNYADAHAALGEVMTDFGQPVEARAELEKAISLGDDRPQTRAYLGLAYATLPVKPSDADNAVKHLLHAEGIGDKSPQLYYGLGLAYVAKREYAKAEKAYETGIQVAPGSEAMRYGLARIYMLTGRNAKGEEMLKTYTVLLRSRQLRESLKNRADSQPNRLDLRLAYADLLMKQGAYDEATGEYLTALKTEPNNVKLYQRLAVASEKAGRPDAAMEARRRAASLQSTPSSNAPPL
jgi:Flp pilus assembly protein TadD